MISDILRHMQRTARSVKSSVASVFYTQPNTGAERFAGHILGVTVCVATVAAAMPFVQKRAQTQRDTADWRERAIAFQTAEPDVGFGPIEAGWRGQAELVVAQNLDAEKSAPALDRAALRDVQSFTAVHYRAAKKRADERDCLAEAIYYEARGESRLGQLAVADVVRNRVNNPNFPSTFCEVVYQGSERSTGCQFTFTCDGSLAREPRGEAWRRARQVANLVVMNTGASVTRRATHYHTTEVNPVWSANLVQTAAIGAHIFYRFPNRAEKRELEAQAVLASAEPFPTLD
jgi:Cell wall hydrolyses involved in spore germination